MNDILRFFSPANNFNEALPIGNGKLGAMCYGGTSEDRFSLNDETLWSGYPEMEKAPQNGPEIYAELKKLALENRIPELEKKTCIEFTGTSSQCFLPFCNLRIFTPEGEITNYKRELDLKSGVAKTEYLLDGKRIEKRAFVGFDSSVLAISFKSEEIIPFLKLKLDSILKCEINSDDDGLVLKGTAPVLNYILHERDDEKLKPEYFEDDAKKGMRFCAFLKAKTDGVVELKEDEICLLNLKSAEIYFSGETSHVAFNVHPYLEGKEETAIARKRLEKAISKGFEALKQEHIKNFSELYSRCEFNLCEPDLRNTDEILKDSSALSRYELLFNMGKYLTISSSRGSEPSNLQGIWNEHLIPPWKSNYTVNINTQMNYYPTLRLGLSECFEPYVRLVKELSLRGEKVAKEWYGIDGIVAHHNVDLWRKAESAGDGMPYCGTYAFFNGSFAWMLCHIFEKYEIEEDIDYLKSIYPLLVKSGETCVQLSAVENGTRFICPSTSPENSFIIKEGAFSLTKSTAISNAIARDVLRKTIRAAEILEDEENAEKFRKILSEFMPDKISESGRIMEWNEDFEEVDPHHRHISHLYALYPGDEITPEKEPELCLACEKTLNERGDEGTGWCIAWKANMWARLGNGNRAKKLLDTQLLPDSGIEISYTGGGTYPNMLCAHPPFQIDGNFGGVSAIMEMLFRNEGNKLYVLPALPDDWKEGSIKGIRLKGGAVLNLSWKNGKPSEVEILPKEKAQNYDIITKLENENGNQ